MRYKLKKKAKKAHVEMQRPEDGGEDEVYFCVTSPDGDPLTGNQIVEAVAEAVLLHWDNLPSDDRSPSEFDA